MVAGRLLLAAALLALPARAAFAQTAPARPPAAPAAPKPARLFISIDGGTQQKSSGFSDAFDVPLYLENEHVSTTYPEYQGVFVSFAARYRLWKHLTAGVGVSSFSDTGDAAITASIPHPFFDNQPRTVSGTASAKREELSVYPTVGWIVPFSSSIQLSLNAGPSIMTVKQPFVTEIHFSETYPYDTALFTSADLTTSSATAVGFYAGADVSWMFSKHLGVGGVIQVTRATVKEKAGDRTVSIDAGGAQAGGGVRFVF
jgi:hypothetical protein